MTTNPPPSGQGSDALSQLEALLQKTKASKGQGQAPQQGIAPVPGGLLPDVQAEAERMAREQAEKEAALQEQLAQAEIERQRALEEQQQKMGELANTPQYQARVQQTEAQQEKVALEKAEHDGHEIRQVTTTKL